ncbi:MAG: hypothetical protein LBR35_02120 [Rickettsiales bacterium]|jgi:outer membrane biosynthesis protein TonB|nr:hypothetical protein [Rickettsiales bacterium]
MWKQIKDFFRQLLKKIKNELYLKDSYSSKGISISMFAHILVFLSFLILPYTLLNSVYRSLSAQAEEKIIYVDLANVKIDTKTYLPEKAAKPKAEVKTDISKPTAPSKPKTLEQHIERIIELKNDALIDDVKATDKNADNSEPKVIKEIKKDSNNDEYKTNFEQVNKNEEEFPETDDTNFIRREQLGGDERYTGQDLSISLTDAIRTKLRSCWNVDPNALGAKDMKISITVELNPDGSVYKVEIQDQERFESDMPFRAMAESARRAVFICSPFDFLPQELYAKWKTAEFNFYPYKGDIE